jgi:hypothetical protein
MITQAVLDLLVSLLSAVFAILPVASLASLLTGVTTAMTAAGAACAGWNAFLPLAELCSILALLLGTWLPAILTYKTANWAWRHFPDIAGFGPGAG